MYERLKLILTEEEINKLKNTKILLVGLGGVGGSCFESLIRCGIGKITIIDNDKFEESNLNRQILSTNNNIGQIKVLEAQKRANSINKYCLINPKEMFLNEANINEINDISTYDYIIDCCDTVKTKILLIKIAKENNIKIISSMGTGNRLDASKLYITDIWKTNNDPLAKAVRNLLRKTNLKTKLPVLTSRELPIKNSNKTIGSAFFVPNTAGILIANYVFNSILSKK